MDLLGLASGHIYYFLAEAGKRDLQCPLQRTALWFTGLLGWGLLQPLTVVRLVAVSAEILSLVIVALKLCTTKCDAYVLFLCMIEGLCCGLAGICLRMIQRLFVATSSAPPLLVMRSVSLEFTICLTCLRHAMLGGFMSYSMWLIYNYLVSVLTWWLS